MIIQGNYPLWIVFPEILTVLHRNESNELHPLLANAAAKSLTPPEKHQS
jgi:hypothetical protein